MRLARHGSPDTSRRQRPTPLRNQNGASFATVLVVLLIAVALYYAYFGVRDAATGKSAGVSAIDTSRAVACRSNRQTLERAVVAWSQTHDGETATLAALTADGIRVPSCPEGGTYSLAGNSVRCGTHQ